VQAGGVRAFCRLGAWDGADGAEGNGVKTVITVIVTVVVVLGLVYGLGFLFRGGAAGDGEKPLTVAVDHPVRGELVEIVSAPGEVEPKTKVAISARFSARIVELPFEEGDKVTAGDPNADPPVPASVLVRLDDTDLRAALTSAEARRAAQAAEIDVARAGIAGQQSNIDAITASLKEARSDLARKTALHEAGDISDSDFEQARLRVDELTAQHAAALKTLESRRLNLTALQHRLTAADAEIAQARDRLSYTTITSPIDGVVTQLNAEVGEVVMTGTMNNPGTMILEVADLSEMLVVARVDEADIGAVEVGQQAVMDLRAYPDERFEGVVESIALVGMGMQRESKEFRVEVLVTRAGRRLYSGLNADIEIETRRHEGVLKVPSQAVLGRRVDELPVKIRESNPNVNRKKTFATVVYRVVDGKAVVTPVTVGASDETHTVIEGGLTGKERVVVGPFKVLEKLKHEGKVKEEKPPATQPATKPATRPATTQARED